MKSGIKFLFHPATIHEYQHVMGQLLKRGYVFDPKRQCKTVDDVWKHWPMLHELWPYLAVYEDTNILDSYSRLDSNWKKDITPLWIVDELPVT